MVSSVEWHCANIEPKPGTELSNLVQGKMIAYEDDCLFADPFAGFNGVARFKKNVSNLGTLTEDVKLDVYEFNELENSVETKWRFSCILSLPWRPRLAAAGSTVHELDKVGLVC